MPSSAVHIRPELAVQGAQRGAHGGAAHKLERGAGRRLRFQLQMPHLEEHAPLPVHQPDLAGLDAHAAAAAGELRGALHRLAGRVPEEAPVQVDLALDVLALGTRLDRALQLALQLRARC